MKRKQNDNTEIKDFKLSRAVKLAAAIAALGSTVGMDVGSVNIHEMPGPAVAAAETASGTEGKHIGQVKHNSPAASFIKLESFTLSNGAKAQIINNRLFIIGADGKQSPAKDGIYELADGRKITVRNGIAIIDVN